MSRFQETALLRLNLDRASWPHARAMTCISETEAAKKLASCFEPFPTLSGAVMADVEALAREELDVDVRHRTRLEGEEVARVL